MFKFGDFVRVTSSHPEYNFWSEAIGMVLDSSWSPQSGNQEYRVRMTHPTLTDIHYDATFEGWHLSSVDTIDYMKYRKRKEWQV